MEDQERASLVDLESGEVLPGGGPLGRGIRETPDLVLARRLQTPWRRSRLGAAAFGQAGAIGGPRAGPRGVFKAFKATLAEHVELERAFRDLRYGRCVRTIANWYDDLREARGARALGPRTPKIPDELLSSDLDILLLSLEKVELP